MTSGGKHCRLYVFVGQLYQFRPVKLSVRWSLPASYGRYIRFLGHWVILVPLEQLDLASASGQLIAIR